MRLQRPPTSQPPSSVAQSRFARFFACPPAQLRWIAWLLWGLIVLNVLDAVFTLIWVRAGVATEANLLIRKMLLEHTALFMATKITLVALGAALLWRRRRNPLALVAVFGGFMAYYWVLLHHLEFASWLVGRLTRT